MPGYYDPQGVWIHDETDAFPLTSTVLNRGMKSVSDALKPLARLLPDARAALARTIAAADRAEAAALKTVPLVAPMDEGIAALIKSPTSKTAQAIAAAVSAGIAAALRAPAYAGSRAKSWDAGRSTYNGESPALSTMRTLVANGKSGTRVRGVMVGDSKMFGSGSGNIKNDSLPGKLTTTLGAKPGLVVGSIWDARWSNRTNVNAPGATSQNFFDCLPNWWVQFDAGESFTSFSVYAFTTGGGTINVQVDGVPQAVFAPGSGAGWKKKTYTGLTPGMHKIVLSGASAATVLGIEVEQESGLTITNAGRPSSAAGDWLQVADWSRNYASSFAVGNTNLTKPDFAVINLGTNTNSFTLAQDLANLETVVTNVHALGIPTMIAAFGGIVSNDDKWDVKRKKLYDLADLLNLPLVDFTHLIGDNATATARGLMADALHENATGYALEAGLLARVLVD